MIPEQKCDTGCGRFITETAMDIYYQHKVISTICGCCYRDKYLELGSPRTILRRFPPPVIDKSIKNPNAVLEWLT